MFFVLKLDLSMTKVNDGYTNKEFKGDYNKFHKPTVSRYNGGISEL